MKELKVDTYQITEEFRKLITHVVLADLDGNVQYLTGGARGEAGVHSLAHALIMKALIDHLNQADMQFKNKIIALSLEEINQQDILPQNKVMIKEIIQQEIFD